MEFRRDQLHCLFCRYTNYCFLIRRIKITNCCGCRGLPFDMEAHVWARLVPVSLRPKYVTLNARFAASQTIKIPAKSILMAGIRNTHNTDFLLRARLRCWNMSKNDHDISLSLLNQNPTTQQVVLVWLLLWRCLTAQCPCAAMNPVSGVS